METLEGEVDVGSVRTRYLECGSGDPVIFLHGASLGSSCDVWCDTVGDYAARGFRSIAPDLPGFGGTLAQDHSIAYRRTFVLAFMQTLGLKKAHLVGHSQAGRIVVEIALEHPSSAASALVLGTGSLLPPDPFRTETAEGDEGGSVEPTRDEIRALLEENLFHRELATDRVIALRHRMSVGAPFSAFLARQRVPREKTGGLWRRLIEVRVPLMLLYGRDDRGNAAARAAQAKAMFPSLDIRVLPDCKHLVQWDAREAFAELGASFMTAARDVSGSA